MINRSGRDDYDVTSYVEGGTAWGLADVGLDRDEAIAAMLLRAFRWGDWDAVPFVKAIVSGTHDPEVPYWVNDSSSAHERRTERHAACFRIARSGDGGEWSPPAIPGPGAWDEFEQSKIDAMRAGHGTS